MLYEQFESDFQIVSVHKQEQFSLGKVIRTSEQVSLSKFYQRLLSKYLTFMLDL